MDEYVYAGDDDVIAGEEEIEATVVLELTLDEGHVVLSNRFLLDPAAQADVFIRGLRDQQAATGAVIQSMHQARLLEPPQLREAHLAVRARLVP